jgi:acetyltransferase/esterase
MTARISSCARRPFCEGLASAVLAIAALRGAAAQTPPQREVRGNVLQVPGARLHYQVDGNGPVMLLIPGATGSAVSFQRLTEHLATDFTVVAYDRRGFSRSGLDGAQDYERRLETEADDARRLIEQVGAPATVFGSSSGAIIALALLARHPAAVRTLVPHEPPAVRLLPDGQKWVDFFLEVYGLYRESGIEPALRRFREQAFGETDRQAMARAPANESTLANARYWFEHELRQYPDVALDIDVLRPHAGRIVLTAGRESRGSVTQRVSVELGKRLGLDLIELPGGHVGFLSHPAEFARELLRALARTRRGP